MTGIVGDALHHRQRHVHVRPPPLLRRTQTHLARGVREVQHLRVHELVAHDREDRRTCERRLHQQARRLAHAVERLVGTDRDGGRVAERRAHRLVTPAAQVERPRERHPARLVGDREDILSALGERQGERCVLVGERLDGNAVCHLRADLLAVPGMPAVRVLAVGVDGIDAFDLRLERLPFRPPRAVGGHASHGYLRLATLGHAEPPGERGADVVREVVAKHARAGDSRTSPVLEHHTLRSRPDRRLGPPVVRKDVGGELRLAVISEHLPVEAAETRPQAMVVVAEMEPLPACWRERHVLEHDRALAGERFRRASVEVLSADGEGERLRSRVRRRLHLHAYLRRREILHLHRMGRQHAPVLARYLRVDRPAAARLVGRYAEHVARQRAAVVRDQRTAGIDVPVRVEKRDLHRERLWRLHRSVAEDGMQEYLLVMAVDATFRPEKCRAFASLEIAESGTLGVRLVHLHRVAEREKRHVIACGRCGHHHEGLAFRHAAHHAPAVRGSRPFRHLDVRGGEHLHAASRDRAPSRERRRPHARLVAALPHAKADVREADHPVAVGILLRTVLLAFPGAHVVAARHVAVADGH